MKHSCIFLNLSKIFRNSLVPQTKKKKIIYFVTSVVYERIFLKSSIDVLYIHVGLKIYDN